MARSRRGIESASRKFTVLRALPLRERAGETGLTEQKFIAVGARRQHRSDLHRPVPIARSRYGAAIGAEPDQRRVPPMSGAAELADVEFAFPAHRGRGGIADVGIVGPDHGF